MEPSSYAAEKKRQKRHQARHQRIRLFDRRHRRRLPLRSGIPSGLWLNALLVCAAFLGFETAVRLPLIIASFVSVIVELFNTAVEAAVDHTSTEKHELAKRAKDAGSAAQLVAMLMLAAVWLSALFG